MRVLVLGHKGMLGRAVLAYLSNDPNLEVETNPFRFDEESFTRSVQDTDADFIINCIGKIPQKNSTQEEYALLNIELPVFLESLGTRVIHPSTDCEFSGDLTVGQAYLRTSLRDANDAYGTSKASISKRIEEEFSNTKIIRTSIIGHETATAVALLDWFLSQTSSVRGYTDHYWNGITTLEWAKQCHRLMNDWGNFPTLNQFGTEKHYSKYDVITLARDVYGKDIDIEPFATEKTVNKCLLSDVKIPELDVQLRELRLFFKK